MNAARASPRPFHSITATKAPLGGEPPTEFLLWAYGDVETAFQVFRFDEADADAVIAEWQQHGIELSFDYEHRAVNSDDIAPAAGWFELEKRLDGLWITNIRWTERAAEMLRAGEYRYWSPAFLYNKNTYHIERLINMGLTNLPATRNIEPLVAKDRPEVQQGEQMKTPLKALGLADNASETEAVATLGGMQQEHGKVLATLGVATLSEAVAMVAGLKAEAERVPALSQQLEFVRAELATLKSLAQKAEFDAILAGEGADKLTPAETEWVRANISDAGALRAYLSVRSATPITQNHNPPTVNTAAFTDAEVAVAKQLSLSPEQMAKAYRKKVS